MVDEVKKWGKTPGIYTSRYMWQDIMGGFDKCTSLGNVDLWYAHYDNEPDFGDFRPFGGWTEPKMKQYNGDKYECGVGIDKNVM